MRLAVLLAVLSLPALAVPAQADEIIPSHCVALSQAHPDIHYVSLDDGQIETGEVRIHFVGHATFLVETAAGVRIATDFTGWVGPDVIPDVVTMNRAHTSHYTLNPDPAIPHVLHGWGESADDPADHYLELRDVIVRNVTTDIRGFGGRQDNGNSIFIFETAGLCIGHLGHLHHEPSDVQFALMGRLDVVMAPVDGGYTMSQSEMIRVLKRVKARLVLPMHWFGPGNLETFLAGMTDEFAVERSAESGIEMSLEGLPRTPTVMVLQPRPYAGD